MSSAGGGADTGYETDDGGAAADALTGRGAVALLAHDGDRVTAAMLAPSEPVVVGRASACGLCVQHATVSRRHARFTLDADAVVVEDLGSRNGTWVAGRRVERAEARVGDEVKLGSLFVSLHAPGSVAHRAAVAARAKGESVAVADELVAGSAMREVLRLAERAADARVPVILQGETGTGKEVLAQLLHERSPRAARRMVRVNCGAIPGELVESTFFGHERGAFTGAVQPQRGVFEEADGGTVFLDEIAELPMPAQAALLRVLEVGAFCRVGSTREVVVDVRVVAATHRDLAAMVREGAFREDLYYRLNTFTLHVPPLRERRDEIERLAQRFVERASRANGRDADRLTPAAVACLLAHDWPGNVRELRNVVERAVVVSRGRVVDVDDLPPWIRASTAPPPRIDEAEAHTGHAGRTGRLQDYEARMITEALEACGWKTADAAQRLHMARRTLTRRMQALGIQRPARGAARDAPKTSDSYP